MKKDKQKVNDYVKWKEKMKGTFMFCMSTKVYEQIRCIKKKLFGGDPVEISFRKIEKIDLERCLT